MWTKTQLIERGVEIVPLRDPSLCDEWVLRSEADKRIAQLERQVEEANVYAHLNAERLDAVTKLPEQWRNIHAAYNPCADDLEAALGGDDE